MSNAIIHRAPLFSSLKEIENLTHINGVPIKVIQERAQPGAYDLHDSIYGKVRNSLAGFLAPGEKLLDVLRKRFIVVSSLGMTHSIFSEQFERIRLVASLYFGKTRHPNHPALNSLLEKIRQANGQINMKDFQDKERDCVEVRFSFQSHEGTKLHKFKVRYFSAGRYVDNLPIMDVWTIGIDDEKTKKELRHRVENGIRPIGQPIGRTWEQRRADLIRLFQIAAFEAHKKGLEESEQLLLVESTCVPPREFEEDPSTNYCQDDIFFNSNSNRNIPSWKHDFEITNAETGETMKMTEGDVAYIDIGFWQTGCKGSPYRQNPSKAWRILTGLPSG